MSGENGYSNGMYTVPMRLSGAFSDVKSVKLKTVFEVSQSSPV